MKRQNGFLLLITSFFVFLSACGAQPAQQPAAAEKPATAAAPANTDSPAAKKKLRIGTTAGFYPYVYKNTETNKVEGFEVDVWDAVSQKLGVTIEWQVAEFSGLFGLLDSGKIDTIANSIAVTDERKKKYVFTEPYVYSGAQLVVKKGNDAIQSLNDLAGKKIGIQSGTNFINFVKSHEKASQITVVNYETAAAGFNDVALGRIDATFATRASALAEIKKSNLALQLAGDQLQVIPAANPFVINDDNKKLAEQANKAFQELRSDGTLTKLSTKWFTADLTKP